MAAIEDRKQKLSQLTERVSALRSAFDQSISAFRDVGFPVIAERLEQTFDRQGTEIEGFLGRARDGGSVSVATARILVATTSLRQLLCADSANCVAMAGHLLEDNLDGDLLQLKKLKAIWTESKGGKVNLMGFSPDADGVRLLNVTLQTFEVLKELGLVREQMQGSKGPQWELSEFGVEVANCLSSIAKPITKIRSSAD
jgi:hypothetical protein